jgi:hypothetical protein
MPFNDRIVEIMGVMNNKPIATITDSVLRRLSIDIIDIALVGPDPGQTLAHIKPSPSTSRGFKYGWGGKPSSSSTSKTAHAKDDDDETLPSDEGKQGRQKKRRT